MRYASALLLALAVSACSGKDSGSNSTAAAGAAQEEAPVNLTIDPGNSAVPVTMPSPTTTATIPAAFQGRWGTVAADCDPAKADIAKGLMTIAGNRLSFYESRGVASNLRQQGTARLSFDLSMSGEGQSWSEPTVLTMDNGGRTLLRQASGSRDRAGAFSYQKCPG